MADYDIQSALVESESVQRAKPFLKWAGSKQALLAHIVPFVPRSFNKYFEPFVGAGSLFLRLQPSSARLSDLSPDLIAVWKAVKNEADEIVGQLSGLKPDREVFYNVRKVRSTNPTTRAAELIYLNKSCFNGLYRVNKLGDFNVPFGLSSNTFVINAENIFACSKLLQNSNAEIIHCDFAEATESAVSGDFVFFDPPYVTKHNFNGFRDYNEKLFSWADQERLAAEARRLRSIGVRVMITNAAHSDIKDLYSGFRFHDFERSSTLASRSASRGRVAEVIFYG